MNKELKIEVPDGYEIDKENSTFEKIVFKKKHTYPKSWGEFCENTQITNEEYFVNTFSCICPIDNNQFRNCKEDKNLCKTEEEAEAFLALIQLKRLWHEYVDNYSGKVDDYYFIDFFTSINGCQCRVLPNCSVISKYLFVFPSRELAEEFLNNVKDLVMKISWLWE